MSLKNIFFLSILLLAGWATPLAYGQRPLPEVELELQQMADEILNHEDFEYKFEQNKAFAALLSQTLRRPESYRYPFDSLQTIGILRAEDNSFRVFTWQIMDQKDPSLRYGPAVHYYFGFIQRKYQTAQGSTEYIVIPLIEMQEVPPGVENMVLDHTQWLGGIYYPAKYHGDEIPRYTFKYYDPKVRKRNGEVKKVRQDMYVLMGWNGLDNRSNIKFVEVLSFDPRDSSRVLFGANVFYFDKLVAKHRAIFRYSEYAPFTLNFGYVKAGLFPWSKKKMIVYDHLGTPKPGEQRLTEIWEMGPDGSYDALEFKRGGRFQWRKNVEVIRKLTRKEIREASENQEKILRARLAQLQLMAQQSGDARLVEQIEKILERDNLDRQAARFIRRKEKMMLERQREMEAEERERLKEIGIDVVDEN